MKIKELVEYLSGFNPEAEIVYVSNFDDYAEKGDSMCKDIILQDFAWDCTTDVSEDSDSKKMTKRVYLIKNGFDFVSSDTETLNEHFE